jgi:hypothetical protein
LSSHYSDSEFRPDVASRNSLHSTSSRTLSGLQWKSVFRDDRSRIDQRVEAHLEDILVGTHVLGGREGRTSGADCCEDDILGAEAEIIVFKLDRPVIGECIFQTETDQETIQGGTGIGVGEGDK